MRRLSRTPRMLLLKRTQKKSLWPRNNFLPTGQQAKISVGRQKVIACGSTDLRPAFQRTFGRPESYSCGVVSPCKRGAGAVGVPTQSACRLSREAEFTTKTSAGVEQTDGWRRILVAKWPLN